MFTIGAGYVDVEAAMNSTDVAKGTAMSPVASFDPKTGNVYLNDDSTRCLEHVVDVVERGGLGIVPVRVRASVGHDDGYQRSVGQQRPVG